MCVFTGIQRVSILRPWQQANLKIWHLCVLSCEYGKKFKALWNVELHQHITPWKQTISFLCILQGVGRRKCPNDRRQQNSHFCLCHDGADNSTGETGKNTTIYQNDFLVKQAVNGPTSARRFPRNHQQKSADAALAQAGEQFMWFGRHDSNHSETLQVLAANNYRYPNV